MWVDGWRAFGEGGGGGGGGGQSCFTLFTHCLAGHRITNPIRQMTLHRLTWDFKKNMKIKSLGYCGWVGSRSSGVSEAWGSAGGPELLSDGAVLSLVPSSVAPSAGSGWTGLSPAVAGVPCSDSWDPSEASARDSAEQTPVKHLLLYFCWIFKLREHNGAGLTRLHRGGLVFSILGLAGRGLFRVGIGLDAGGRLRLFLSGSFHLLCCFPLPLLRPSGEPPPLQQPFQLPASPCPPPLSDCTATQTQTTHQSLAVRLAFELRLNTQAICSAIKLNFTPVWARYWRSLCSPGTSSSSPGAGPRFEAALLQASSVWKSRYDD